VHESPPCEEPATGTPPDIGRENGRKVHLLFPGGVEVSEEPREHCLKGCIEPAKPTGAAVYQQQVSMAERAMLWASR
jgi:hypothetical protein